MYECGMHRTKPAKRDIESSIGLCHETGLATLLALGNCAPDQADYIESALQARAEGRANRK